MGRRVSSVKQEVIQRAEEKPKQRGPNLTGIPTQMKLDFEQRSGLSFDDVRVHYNSDRPKRIGARAYAQGTQVYMGPRQEQYLQHELGHIVQQKQGRVRPTVQIGHLLINTSSSLETEADSSSVFDQASQVASSTNTSKGNIVLQGSFVSENGLATTLRDQQILQNFVQEHRDKDELFYRGQVDLNKLCTLGESLVQGNNPLREIASQKIFYQGKIAPFTSVGFEHEFAKGVADNPFENLTHVKLGESGEFTHYFNRPFSLETDSGNKLELVSPPLLIEANSDAIPASDAVTRLNSQFENLLRNISASRTNINGLLVELNNLTSGMIDIRLLRSIIVKATNVVNDSRIKESYRIESGNPNIIALDSPKLGMDYYLEQIQDINPQANIVTDPTYFLYNHLPTSNWMYTYFDSKTESGLDQGIYSILSNAPGLEAESFYQSVLITLVTRLFDQVPAIIAEHYLQKQREKYFKNLKKKSKVKDSKSTAASFNFSRAYASAIKDVNQTWIKASSFSLLRELVNKKEYVNSWNRICEFLRIDTTYKIILDQIQKSVLAMKQYFDISKKSTTWTKKEISDTFQSVFNAIINVKDHDTMFPNMRDDTYVSIEQDLLPSFPDAEFKLMEIRPSAQNTEGNNQSFANKLFEAQLGANKKFQRDENPQSNGVKENPQRKKHKHKHKRHLSEKEKKQPKEDV